MAEVAWDGSQMLPPPDWPILLAYRLTVKALAGTLTGSIVSELFEVCRNDDFMTSQAIHSTLDALLYRWEDTHG